MFVFLRVLFVFVFRGRAAGGSCRRIPRRAVRNEPYGSVMALTMHLGVRRACTNVHGCQRGGGGECVFFSYRATRCACATRGGVTGGGRGRGGRAGREGQIRGTPRAPGGMPRVPRTVPCTRTTKAKQATATAENRVRQREENNTANARGGLANPARGQPTAGHGGGGHRQGAARAWARARARRPCATYAGADVV